MKSPRPLHLFVAVASAALLVGPLAADVIETKNGARIVGTVVKIDAGTIHVKTDYAGDLAIKQSEVTGVTTDEAISVRLASGTVLSGKVTSEAGAMKISGADGELTTKVEKVAATWSAVGEDPQVIAARQALAAQERRWTYEAGVDATGKTGNKEQLGTAVSARATLKTAQDTLQFYTAYDRQVSDGAKSSDQLKVGVDYQNNFSGKRSWYVRNEGGFDRVKDVELYDVAGAGLGYDLVKQANHTLTGRAGLSFRYEGYKNALTEDVKSAGLDFGLNQEWTFSASKLVNRLAFVPTFEDFGNFRLSHESFLELPLANPSWSVRLGVSNDYNSTPGAGVDKLDTSYFTRLVLRWE